MAHATRPHRDSGRLVFLRMRWEPTPLLWLPSNRLYAPVGERAFFEIPRNRTKNTTHLRSMTTGGMGPSMAVEGATTARVFETYIEKVLVPSLKEGQRSW